MDILLNYSLIGIGEFSHGIQEYINTYTFNYILFWNKVTELKLYKHI